MAPQLLGFRESAQFWQKQQRMAMVSPNRRTSPLWIPWKQFRRFIHKQAVSMLLFMQYRATQHCREGDSNIKEMPPINPVGRACPALIGELHPWQAWSPVKRQILLLTIARQSPANNMDLTYPDTNFRSQRKKLHQEILYCALSFLRLKTTSGIKCTIRQIFHILFDVFVSCSRNLPLQLQSWCRLEQQSGSRGSSMADFTIEGSIDITPGSVDSQVDKTQTNAIQFQNFNRLMKTQGSFKSHSLFKLNLKQFRANV